MFFQILEYEYNYFCWPL